MDLQQPIDYAQMFQELVTRRVHLTIQREQTEVELVKVAQLLSAIYPLLSEDQQKQHKGTMERVENESGGLQDAIKLVFSRHAGESLSPAMVRSSLVEMGFDFRNYQANPLASITTALKRLVPSYLESVSTETGVTYRRKSAQHPANNLRAHVNVSPGASNSLATYLALHDPRPTPGDLKRKVRERLEVTEEFKPRLGTPDPLNRRGKK